MKRFPKRNLFLIILILAFLVFPFGSKAQGPGDPGCNPYGYRQLPDGSWVLCPFDDGIYALIGIAVLYGIKKVKDARKPASD